MRAYRALFQNRNFLVHWLAGATSNIGDFLNSLAIVKLLSQDPARLGFYTSLIMISKVLPSLLLGPLAGSVADRLPRKLVMVLSDLARALLVFALVFVDQPWIILTLVFLSAVAAAFFQPASSALLPSLVKPDELVAAGSLAVVTQRLAMLLGNGLGAAILILVGAHNVFYITTGCFLLSALLLSRLRVEPLEVEAESARQPLLAKFATDMRQTLELVRERPALRNLLLSLGIAGVGDSAINVLLVTFFTVTLGMAAEVMGIVWALFAATALIGALVIGVIGNRVHWRHLLSFGAAYIWFTMVGAMLTASLIPSTAFLALLGLGSGAINVGLQAAVAELVPAQMRGRIFGTWGTVQSLIFIVGNLIAGSLSDRIGPVSTMLGFSTAYLATALFSHFSLRSLGRSEVAATREVGVGD